MKRQISDLQKEVENLKNENKKLKNENTDIVKCMEALTGKTQPYKTVDTSHSTFLISNRFIQFSTSKVIQPINITIALLNSQSAAFGNATTASPLAGSTLTIFFFTPPGPTSLKIVVTVQSSVLESYSNELKYM